MRVTILLNKTIIATLMLMAFVFGGCNNSGKTSEQTDEKKNDSVSSEMATDSKITIIAEPQCPKRGTLFFDKSSSMRGYMESSNDSRFYGAIASLVNLANVDSCCFYGEKEEKGIDKESFDDLLNKRDIKWSGESDIKSMIASMIEHINKKGDDICLLVTDGILSGSNEDIKNSPDRSYNITHREQLSHNIAALFEKESVEMSALIIRYEAKFNTSPKPNMKGGWYYYCYNNDQKIINNQDRPFFIIAMGKLEYVKYLENALNKAIAENKLNESVSLKISTPTDIVLFGENFDIYENIKLSYSEGIKTEPKNPNLLIIKSEYRKDGMVSLTADISTLPLYMQSLEFMNNNIEITIQHGQKNAKLLANEYREFSVDEVNGKTILKISIKASQLKDSRLTCELKYSLPKWIGTKSDDNDLNILENPLKMGKTFNFWYLIKGFEALQKDKTVNKQSLEFK